MIYISLEKIFYGVLYGKADEIDIYKPMLGKNKTWQPNGNQMVPQDRIGKDSIEEVIKDSKQSYGEFNKVKLTIEESEKLTERMGEKNTLLLIAELDTYIASKGKKYSSHYATILGWARRKVGDLQQKQTKIVKL